MAQFKCLFFSIIIICVCMQTAGAQGSTSQNITNALTGVKQLFGKKKKNTTKADSTGAPSASSTPVAAQQITSGNQPANMAAFAGSHTHTLVYVKDVAPNAKVIDCDEMGPFNLGAAVIKKGMSVALIDSAGNIIVPYNTYTSIDNTTNAMSITGTGIFKASGSGFQDVYINSHGKIIYDSRKAPSNVSSGTSMDGKFIITNAMPKEASANTPIKCLIIDKDGKRHPFTFNYNELQFKVADSIVVNYKSVVGKYSYGLMNLDGTVILKPTYDYIQGFYHGTAIFDQTDQFGKTTYGILNKKGKVIAAGFVQQLTQTLDFRTKDIQTIIGYAHDDFKEAQINVTTGKIIYKKTESYPNETYNFTPSASGYSHSDRTKITPGSSLMDKDGNIVNEYAFLKTLGINIGPSQRFDFAAANDPSIATNLIYFRLVEGNSTSHIYYSCIYNPENGYSIIGSFVDPKNIYFDPVSHLAHVQLVTGKSYNNGQAVYFDGYMNDKGQFKLVRPE